MKSKIAFLLPLLIFLTVSAYSFCGFYVARADASLFNHRSEVIMVRDGQRMVITMSNDFQGDVKDFAMVVPVPVVLQENDISIADRLMFDRFDAYSGPRVVEYYDDNPCHQYLHYGNTRQFSSVAESSMALEDESVSARSMGVTIEATYTIGEYDILILSAKESGGLKTWLTQNGYKIPAQAEEVLDPYIKNGLKFFVVKVNLDQMAANGFQQLRPIQIRFNSDRFMLPIRLGMANAESAQDLVIYAITRQGRVETTNYRTVQIPTDRDVPLFVQRDFGTFYKDLFDRSYQRENQKAVFLEYAWDVSPRNFVKCDPCVSTPPQPHDLVAAGAEWLAENPHMGEAFFTRLHVRYTREKFPMDLQFQVTPNRASFQGRYVTRHPAKGDLSCDAGKQYLDELTQRRKREVDELQALAGWNNDYSQYVYEFVTKRDYRYHWEKRNEVFPGWLIDLGRQQKIKWIASGIALLLSVLSVGWLFRRLRLS